VFEPDPLIVTLTTSQLEGVVERAIERKLAALAPTEKGPENLTINECAKLLRRSRRQIERYIAVGRIRASKSPWGGTVLIPRTEVRRLIEQGLR
jgi:excisionase family DNA binding protein